MKASALLWPGYYDIVILPPAPVRDHAIELSQRLYRYGGQWRLGRRTFLPHISLYHIPVPDDDMESFLDRLQHVVDTAQWGSLETTGYDVPVMTVSRPDWLKQLHRRVIRQTVRYFNWKYQVDKLWNLHRFTGRRLEFAERYLREFGTPMAGMNFRPHITLSNFAGKGQTDAEEIGKHIRHFSFRIDRLHVCELGRSHSCQKIVRELRPQGRMR